MFAGFNNRKISSIGGDFDRDGVKNRKDCEPLNFRKQGEGHSEKVICTDCGYGYNEDWVIIPKKGKRFKCPKCGDTFRYDENLDLHEEGFQ